MKHELISRGSLECPDDLEREYRERKRTTIEQSIPTRSQVPEGWSIKRRGKTRLRIQRPKDTGQALEDRVWTLLYDFGVDYISTDRFSLVLRQRDNTDKTKQIDVLAVDGNTAFVVECKARSELGRQSLKRDISEFIGNMGDVRTSLRTILDRRDLQCVFVMATENIEWSDNDRIDAADGGLVVWDEYDLMSIGELTQVAGEGAKYLVYNRLFQNKEVKNFRARVPALKGKMGGKTYYCFVLSPEHLLKIAFVHHRAPGGRFDDLSDSYQRMIDKNRLRQIEQYIELGGFFPGSIIVNFTRPLQEDAMCEKRLLETVRHDAKPVLLTLPAYYGCAWIIDGQHRLYGFADTTKKCTETVPVIAFVNESTHSQAKMFVDINKNQKAVEASLLWDLYEDLYAESEVERERTLHTISRLGKRLNDDKSSPFRDSIKIPKDGNPGNLTLYAVCNAIAKYKLVSPAEGLLFHCDYEETVAFAAERISAFFEVFRSEFPNEWRQGDKHYLHTNASLPVLFGILRDIVSTNLERPRELANIDAFRSACERLLSPLIKHFREATISQIDAYRKAGGALEKSSQIREEFSRLMRPNGFRSTWLEERERAAEQRSAGASALSLKALIESDEGECLEFKGSVSFDVSRYLLGDHKTVRKDGLEDEGVLRSIVGFLNARGGELLVGVLEAADFPADLRTPGNGLIAVADKLVLGISVEYDKKGWDSYRRRLADLVGSRIFGDEMFDEELVHIEKVEYVDPSSGESVDLCRIRVGRSESKQFLKERLFYVRHGNETLELHGLAIDEYWRKRN